MAQNFVGSNNLPLLFPGGQFGSRYENKEKEKEKKTERKIN